MPAKSIIRDYLWRIQPKRMHRRMLKAGLFHSEIEEHLVSAMLDPNTTAIDAGANIGRYTAIFQNHCKRVIAFEPNPTISEALTRAGYPNVKIIPKALSRHADKTVLNVPMSDDGEMGALGTLEAAAPDLPHTTHSVDAVTLDAHASPDIGFVKIDVEGHEVEVVAGGRDLIKTARPDFMIEAEERYRPGTIDHLKAYFAELGYRCFFVHRGRTHSGHAFETAMQDPANLYDKTRPRRFRAYVNNFFFVPSMDRETVTRCLLDVRLSQMRAEAPDWFGR